MNGERAGPVVMEKENGIQNTVPPTPPKITFLLSVAMIIVEGIELLVV
jgi:hypothetical protein